MFDNESVEIKNYMEVVTFNMINRVLKEMGVCQCEVCIADIAAIVLNSLPPKYVVTRKGELYTKVNILMQQFEVDVVAGIAKAATIVKKYPRHEVEE